MPGHLLHEGATVTCLHLGEASPLRASPRVTVSGQPVVTQPAPYSVTGCKLPPPPVANGPCVTAQWITAAVRVTAGGEPVLLDVSEAVCAPSGTGLVVGAVQPRVTAL
jgi:hypothetical protein